MVFVAVSVSVAVAFDPPPLKELNRHVDPAAPVAVMPERYVPKFKPFETDKPEVYCPPDMLNAPICTMATLPVSAAVKLAEADVSVEDPAVVTASVTCLVFPVAPYPFTLMTPFVMGALTAPVNAAPASAAPPRFASAPAAVGALVPPCAMSQVTPVAAPHPALMLVPGYKPVSVTGDG